jgi:hypothetical protein
MKIKSPGKILKMWKKGTADYLKLNEAESLEPQEDFLNKKVIKGLERLRRVAAVAANGGSADGDEFAAARDATVESLEKFRKLFKAKKGQPKVKKFYQATCRLTLVIEQLDLGGLDANEDEAPASALDDMDPDELDRREDANEDAASAEAGPDGIPDAPPAPGQPPAAPAQDGTAYRKRRKVLEPDLLRALKEQRGDTSRMRATLAFAEEKARANEHASALQALDTLEGLVRTALGMVPPPLDGEAETRRFTERLKGLLPRVLQAQKANPAIATDLKLQISEAQVFQRKKDFARAHALLDAVEGRIKTGTNGAAANSPTPQASTKPDAPRPEAPKPAATGTAGWQAALKQVLGHLKTVAAAVGRINDPEATKAEITLKCIAKNLTPNPKTPQQLAELHRYLSTDDVITAAEKVPAQFGALRIREPLLKALLSLQA